MTTQEIVLFNKVDYSDHKLLRKLYAQYEGLHSVGTKNQVALCICMDLVQAIENAFLTEKEKNIMNVYIETGGEIEAIINKMNLARATIFRNIGSAIKKISIFLREY